MSKMSSSVEGCCAAIHFLLINKCTDRYEIQISCFNGSESMFFFCGRADFGDFEADSCF